MEAEGVIAYIILFFALLGVLACLVIYRALQKHTPSERDEAVSPPPTPSSWPWELTWLTCLTASTAALLIVQVILGICIASLVLLADSVHGASDCATYGLAAFVEYVKYAFERRAVSQEMSVGIDRASALFSAAVVLVTSGAVAAEAAIQLSKRTGRQESTALGNAMLAVAALGALMNLALLLLHSRLRSMSESSRPKRGSHRAEAGHVSFHAALHPGCQGHCHSHDGSNHPEEAWNLNVYGVLLHVITDVVRTLLMLVVGGLVRWGVLTDAARVDAICAIAICACVSFGSAWLLGAVVRAARRPSLSRGSGDEPPAASYGAAA